MAALLLVVRPTYRHWQGTRDNLAALGAEHTILAGNLAQSDQVVRAADELTRVPAQTASDEVTLSQYLKSLESATSAQHVELVTMTPQPVENHSGYKLYRVRLVVACRLPDALRFIDAVTRGHASLAPSGVGEFTLRASQTPGQVELSLSLVSMRQLTQSNSDGRTAGP
jgi:hypothetical protein